MGKCSSCSFSRTRTERVLCFVAPPHLEQDDGYSSLVDSRVDVTSRPAACSAYQKESAAEQFDDMTESIEALIPMELVSSNYVDTEVAWSCSYARMSIAYNTIKMYETKSYPVTEKMLEFIARFERIFPYHEVPDLMETA